VLAALEQLLEDVASCVLVGEQRAELGCVRVESCDDLMVERVEPRPEVLVGV